jgi:gamma-glutamyltranspeptidase/glutathione hydrolase
VVLRHTLHSRSMSGRFRVAGLIPFVASVSLAAAAPAPPAQPAQAARASEGVSTENRQATRAAMSVLAAGGNAVDAAVTAALVAGVASPRSSGLGGGGFALVYLAAERSCKILDFREVAPRALDAVAFERRPFPEAERGRLVGVPGEPLGLHELHRRYGKRAWRDVVAPAERIAQNGFVVEAHLAEVLTGPSSFGSSAALLKRNPELASVYFPGGKPALAGARLTNPRLARTLGRFKNEGPRAIYEGEIASDIVASARALGGAVALEDLAAYTVSERAPLVARWEGYEVQTMPPPSAGGLMLAQTLGMFSKRELETLGTGTLGVHLLAEAMRASSADRSCCVGDPAFVPVDVQKLLAPEALARKKRALSADRTHLVRRFVESLHGTHHIVTTDRAGNVVALTTTVNSSFGADAAAEKSGIVLNDELDDFTSNADAQKLGVKDNPNPPRAGAKPVSSMSPTIVFRDGRPVLAIGGSGGTTIPQNVFQVMASVLVRSTPAQAAVTERRFSLAARDATLVVEPEFTEAERADLVWRGEILRASQRVPLAVQLLAWGERGLEGGADPRKHGLAVVR